MNKSHTKTARTIRELRIIGGEFRSRKLRFEEAPGLRPTPNRVRETLFNWLGTDIINARCLDLFAGSGALGFESLSRGANTITMVENAENVCLMLRENCSLLGTKDVEVIHQNALDWLDQHLNTSLRYDILFLDPPFHSELLTHCCQQIGKSPLVREGGWIYVESSTSADPTEFPKNWLQHREKTAGDVIYRLFLQTSPAD